MSSPYKRFFERTLEQITQRTKIIANASPTPSTPPIRLITLQQSTDLSNYAVGSDGDIGGRSKANLSFDDKYHFGRFHGTLNSSIPDEWKKNLQEGEIAKSGYAGFRSKTRTTLFGTATWDLSLHPYIAINIKPNSTDHLSYFVNIQTEGAIKTDLFQHRLFVNKSIQDFQTVVLPLSSFVLTNNGQTSDKQLPIMREKVRTIGLSILPDQQQPSVGRGRVESQGQEFDVGIKWIEAWAKND